MAEKPAVSLRDPVDLAAWLVDQHFVGEIAGEATRGFARTQQSRPGRSGEGDDVHVVGGHDCDAVDALAVLRKIAGLTSGTPQETTPCIANVNGDSTIDVGDALYIRRFAAGL